jgi:hypothetical protein
MIPAKLNDVTLLLCRWIIPQAVEHGETSG